jgi:hypothetical protein
VASDIVLDFPQPIVTPRHIRSTIVLSSIDSIRGAGHEEAYFAALAPEARETIVTSVVGMWLPIAIGHAHYRACGALGLSAETEVQLGRGTFGRSKGLLLGTAVKLATGAGVTPWTVFPLFQRFWLRAYDGGALRVVRVGPKEADVELVAFPIVESRYYRHAVRGLLCGVVELFCGKAYVKERSVSDPKTAITFRVQWV